MYDAFYHLIYSQLFNNGDAIHLDEITFQFGAYGLDMSQYLSTLIALICTIIVYTVCCLMVWKVIRLFGRLWSRF